RRPALLSCSAGGGGPGAWSLFACPGGVLVSPESFFACPGGVISSPWSFFACPGGIFACPAGVTEAGGWRTAAAGWDGGGDGFSGTVAVGGAVVEPLVCFGRPALAGFVAFPATGVTATIGVTAASGDTDVLCCEM